MLIAGSPIAGTPIASDLLEAAGATVVPDSPAAHRVAASPQRTAHASVIGYALAFAALGALLGPTDSIGATNYTVGTHRAAIAAAQPKPQTFRAVIPTTAAADDPVGRFRATPPQTATTPAPYVRGTPPASVAPGADTPITRWRLSRPQYPENGRPRVWGTAPESVTEVFAIARSFTAEQDVWNVIAPQFWGRPVVEGTPPPSGTDTIGSLAYTVGTHRAAWAEANGRGTWVRGTPPDSVAAPEAQPGRPIIVSPQQVTGGAARLWRPYIAPVADVPPPSFHFAYQVVIDTASGRVWGRPVVEAVVGTDVPVGVFRSSVQQFFVPPTYGRVQRMDVDAIGPPPAPGTVDEYIIRARRRGRR